MINIAILLIIIGCGCFLTGLFIHIAALTFRKTDKSEYVFSCCFCSQCYTLGMLCDILAFLILIILK